MKGEPEGPVKKSLVKNPKEQFVFKGFTQVREFRVFAFECVAPDWTRTRFTVRTDVALTRRYGIPLQDLPLLCRAVLEQLREGEEQRAFTYTEDDMRLFADGAAARKAAAKPRKPPRAPSSGNAGGGWRDSSAFRAQPSLDK